MMEQTIPLAEGEEDINPALRAFISQHIGSFVKWDLIRFFHDLPDSVEVADSVARATGRELETVVPALIELTESGLLESSNMHSGETAYMLASDHRLRTLTNSFILACDDSQFRIKAIYHVIHNLQTKVRGGYEQSGRI